MHIHMKYDNGIQRHSPPRKRMDAMWMVNLSEDLYRYRISITFPVLIVKPPYRLNWACTWTSFVIFEVIRCSQAQAWDRIWRWRGWWGCGIGDNEQKSCAAMKGAREERGERREERGRRREKIGKRWDCERLLNKQARPVQSHRQIVKSSPVQTGGIATGLRALRVLDSLSRVDTAGGA